MKSPLTSDASLWTSGDYAGGVLGLGTFIPRLRVIIDPRYLAIGALLPDLIDKPIGRVIFASTLANGRIIGHTLLFTLLIALTGVHLYEKRKDSIRLVLASGFFSTFWKIRCGRGPQHFSGLSSD